MKVLFKLRRLFLSSPRKRGSSGPKMDSRLRGNDGTGGSGRCWRSPLWFVGLVALMPNVTFAAVAVTDDRGDKLSLQAPAQRIVSLAPHATELLFAAGAGHKLVGAVNYSDYPESAKAVPRVGGYKGIDLERVLALKPDVVVAWHSGNGEPLIERLRKLGLPVFVTEPRQLDDIATAIEKLGKLAGTEAKARSAADDFRRKREALAARYSAQRPVRVFYQIWNRPLMTINGEQLISQTLRLCGGRNVFADLPNLSTAVDVEAVLAADPEAIIASGMGEHRPEWLDDWKRWPSLTAVKRGNLFFIPPDLIQRHSPRVLEGAEQLCGQLEEARGKGPAPGGRGEKRHGFPLSRE
jgi:iron complex transport system substrate-binding protein